MLRVNDSDQAEWAVVKGPHAERARSNQTPNGAKFVMQAQRRDAALKAVDWKRRQDVSRPPTMTVVDAEGCGFVQVYGWTADRAETVVVSLDGSELGLSSSPAVFDLSRQLVNLSVAVHVYDTPRHQFDFCSDVRMNPPDSVGLEIWHAVAGTMALEFSLPGIRAHNPGLRRATVTLNNVVLRNAAGRTLSVPQPVRLTAVVGSIGG